MSFNINAVFARVASIKSTPFVPTPIAVPDSCFAHVDDHPMLDLIRPDMEDGPWIAGGTPLLWYQGKPAGSSDIDVFVKDEKQLEALNSRIKSLEESTNVSDSTNAVTYKIIVGKITWTVQLIRCNFFPSPQALIDSFDITVCKIVSDGFSYMAAPEMIKHLEKRELVFSKIHPGSIKRLIKYWSYGYTPSKETMDCITTHPDVLWTFSLTENEYDHFV